LSTNVGGKMATKKLIKIRVEKKNRRSSGLIYKNQSKKSSKK
jgi:hypothetical protein